MDINVIEKALKSAGLSISGVSQPPKPHATDKPATFVAVGDAFVRVDWASEPSKADEQKAADVLKGMGIGDIGFVLSSVARG